MPRILVSRVVQTIRAVLVWGGCLEFDGSSRGVDVISVFEAATVDGGAYIRLECRIKDLDLRTGNLIMRIAEGTPYRYPRQQHSFTEFFVLPLMIHKL